MAVETLRAMLAVALDAGLVAVNPAAKVRLPPAPPPERTPADRVLDLAGAERLLTAARDLRQETILRAALEAGLRRGEIAGLRWPDVRLEERRLVVRQAIHQDASTGKVARRPKSGRVARVAIGEAFAEALGRWYAASVVVGGAPADGFVWPGRDGRSPMSPSSLSHLVRKVGRRAGLVDAKGRHVARLHGLRHTAGSIALAEGVPLTVVSAQLDTRVRTSPRASTRTSSATRSSTASPVPTARGRCGRRCGEREPQSRTAWPRGSRR